MSISHPLRRRFLVFLVVLATALTALAGPAAQTALAGDRARMLRLVNDDRKDANRHALDLSRKLSRRAAHNSRRMADAGELMHSRRLRGGMTENVGMGPTLPIIERAFMRSDPHRRNILDPDAKRMGVGVVKQGGTFWVTLIFV